ncbi:MAG TPA: hypothetical protein VKM72_17430 [Thermoanaerobaculia bacterium]|nr:hypothetical protein [Thermoanaerobaculia bacterium]
MVQFVVVFGVLWGFIEALNYFDIRPFGDTPRPLGFILLLSLSANIMLASKFSQTKEGEIDQSKGGVISSGPLPEYDYSEVHKQLTDNDLRVILSLGHQRNTLPSQIFSRAFGSFNGSIEELDSFCRRLVLLTELGLIHTIGGSEVAITDQGLQFVTQTRADPKFGHLS